MNIPSLFSTKERLAMLQFVLAHQGTYKVNSVAKQLRLSKGIVSKYLSMLVDEGILYRENNDFSVRDMLTARAIKIFLNLQMVDRHFFKHFPLVKAAGLYGIYAKGKNTEESDIDVWILTKKANEEALAKVTHFLQKSNQKIKPYYLNSEKLSILKKEDPVFYYALVFGSITLYGGDLDEQEL